MIKKFYKERDLTQEFLRSILSYNPETGELTRISTPRKDLVGKRADHVNQALGYRVVGIGSDRTFWAHRVIFMMVYGRWPVQVDHINGDRSDNRLCNLREASKAENMRNRGPQKNNTSGVPGVYWATRLEKWTAGIKVDRRKIWLGNFDSFDEAVAARKSAERRYWGEFAPTKLAA